MRTRALTVLLAINVIVFVLVHTVGRDPSGDAFFDAHFVASAEAVLSGRVWTLLTSAFMHKAPEHLLFNGLAIYFFGRDVHRVVGPRGFVHLYFAGGIVASLGHVVFTLFTGEPIGTIGASGAAMAIAVVFAMLYPGRTIYIQFLFPVPAILAVAGFIIIDLVGLLNSGSGIAHAAHLGGAAYGAGYFWLTIRPRLFPKNPE